MIRFNKLTQAVVDNLVAIEAAGGEQAGEAREVINGVYADVPSFNENVERLAVDIAKKFGMSTAELLGVRVQKKEAPLGVILSPSLEHVRAMFASESGGRVQLSKLTIDVVACSLCPHSYYDDAKRRKMYRAVAADVLGYLVEAGVLKVENELGKEWYSVNTTGDAGGPCGGRAGGRARKEGVMDLDSITIERLEGESELAYEYLLAYCQMGASRSQAKLAEIDIIDGQKRGVSTINDWSRKYNWVARAEQFDRQRTARLLEATEGALHAELLALIAYRAKMDMHFLTRFYLLVDKFLKRAESFIDQAEDADLFKGSVGWLFRPMLMFSKFISENEALQTDEEGSGSDGLE